jgi:hypothetical protein
LQHATVQRLGARQVAGLHGRPGRFERCRLARDGDADGRGRAIRDRLLRCGCDDRSPGGLRGNLPGGARRRSRRSRGCCRCDAAGRCTDRAGFLVGSGHGLPAIRDRRWGYGFGSAVGSGVGSGTGRRGTGRRRLDHGRSQGRRHEGRDRCIDPAVVEEQAGQQQADEQRQADQPGQCRSTAAGGDTRDARRGGGTDHARRGSDGTRAARCGSGTDRARRGSNGSSAARCGGGTDHARRGGGSHDAGRGSRRRHWRCGRSARRSTQRCGWGLTARRARIACRPRREQRFGR